MVDMRRLDNDLGDLPIERVEIQIIVRKLRDAGLIWFYRAQMVVVKPFVCPNCGRTDERVSKHVNECLRRQRKLAEWKSRLTP